MVNVRAEFQTHSGNGSEAGESKETACSPLHIVVRAQFAPQRFRYDLSLQFFESEKRGRQLFLPAALNFQVERMVYLERSRFFVAEPGAEKNGAIVFPQLKTNAVYRFRAPPELLLGQHAVPRQPQPVLDASAFIPAFETESDASAKTAQHRAGRVG